MAADEVALRQGLRPGMPLAKAQVLVPGLRIEDADPAGDIGALERLAFWALRYSPVVAADTPDGIILDIEGAAHLLGGNEGFARNLHDRLNAAGYTCQIGIADTWGAAHALARFGPDLIGIVRRIPLERVIAPMPIAALRLEPTLVAELRSLGFEQVADLLSQPRAPLTLRFGPQIWRRIDQALGSVPEPIDPVGPADMIEVRRAFAEPIGAAETIKRYIAQLVEQLCERLEERGQGARRLDLVCHRVDAQQQSVRIGTAMPTRERKRLVRMLSDKVAEIEPGFGIELMGLAATWTQATEPTQDLSSLIDPSAPDVSDLVDILANRVGEDRLYRVAPVPSDVPERSVERIPALSPDRESSWSGNWPRPSRLLARPASAAGDSLVYSVRLSVLA
jgi:protein ImuB